MEEEWGGRSLLMRWAREIHLSAAAGAMLANRGLEYPLEDLTNTLQLNSLEHAAELCEAVGLEMTRNADNTPVAIIPKARSPRLSPGQSSAPTSLHVSPTSML